MHRIPNYHVLDAAAIGVDAIGMNGYGEDSPGEPYAAVMRVDGWPRVVVVAPLGRESWNDVTTGSFREDVRLAAEMYPLAWPGPIRLEFDPVGPAHRHEDVGELVARR
ncbi:MAG: hypothetical protein ACJ8FM_18990 [Xanthobacteraceae bacterium]